MAAVPAWLLLALRAVVAGVVACIVVYTVRHIVFTLNRLFARQRHPYLDIDSADWPSVTVVVPALARTASLDVRFSPAWPLAGAPFHAGGGSVETFASARPEHMLECAAGSGPGDGRGVGGVHRATRHLG